MDQFVEGLKVALNTYGPVAIKAALTLFAGWIGARIITAVLRRVMVKARIEATLVGFATSLTFAALMTLAVVVALGSLGVPTASFVAVIGAAGLAIGFALQGSLANFAAGVLLIIFRPFKAGDYIEGGGVSGTVEEIQVFATLMKTPDNKRVIVPNSAMTNASITNFSANDTRRIDLVFGIGYGDDIVKAKKVLEEILAGEPRVLADPASTVAVAELGDSSVNFVVRPWVKTADYWAVRFDLTEAVKRRFDAERISIPFPQRDVHLHQVA